MYRITKAIHDFHVMNGSVKTVAFTELLGLLFDYELKSHLIELEDLTRDYYSSENKSGFIDDFTIIEVGLGSLAVSLHGILLRLVNL